MPLKSILVVLSGIRGEEARLTAAFALAKHHGAKVAALHVKPTPAIYAGYPGGDVPVALIESQEEEIDRAAAAVEKEIKEQASKAGTAIDWRIEEGDEVDIAGIHARYFDLVIASPDLARDLVFASAAPVLAFPEGAATGIPKRVLIAWNGSREASRAVRDGMSLIEAAEQVSVLVVDPPEERSIGNDIGLALSHHGIKTDLRQRPSEGADVGAILLEEARTGGADLLVMGAYGHSRLREWVLGGATESALTGAKIPVLLSH